MYIVSILSIIIPSAVTVLGFFISYKQNKKYIETEVLKNKKIQMSSKGLEVIDKAVVLVDFKKVSQLNDIELSDLVNSILIYGTNDAVKILSDFMQFNYKYSQSEKISVAEKSYKLLAYVALLIAQIKYDNSGEIINPLDILKIRLNDFHKNKNLVNQITANIKKIVEELDLKKEFIKVIK
ncbi:MAG: hypothetical protein SOX68_06510 [Faecalicoccus sp.]|uniref:Uncharacterized protein n=1 Tax=Faecalicoccus pleomorphus TaxID=1323 RepID=A0A7X9RKA8_9FIRM|nr:MULTISPECIES: hypothetical protein [Faecalicoccus]MDY4278591.1 hypothetical protein [Faecalicoccus sp.]NME45129.1 hypothetical protein [Faecalicoccus pleomorphus]